MADYIGAIDQGTTSTRFMLFDRSGKIAAVAQKEHRQIYPQPGWVEHDALEIWQCTQEVIAEAMAARDLRPADLAAIGITNQRGNRRHLESQDGQADQQRYRMAGHARC